MDRGVDAAGWPYPARLAGAVTAGVAWAFLWVGMFALQLNALVFWAASLALAAPVLAALGRNPLEHLVMAALAYVAAAGVSFFLIPFISTEVSMGAGLAGDILRQSAVAWSPAWVAIVVIHAVRRRRPVEAVAAKAA